MSRIVSNIMSKSKEYLSNRDDMLQLIEQVRSRELRIRNISNSRKDKFESRGQLLPRERVSLLLDPGSPWLELSTLAGLGMHDDDGVKNILGGGLIVGVGYVTGTRCLIKANDSAIKGGTIAPMGLKKGLRAQQIALENRLPIIDLVESGGANLRYQSEIFVEGGRSFYNQARLSAIGIPQISVVHGSSTAGGAYQPGLSDYVIMVKGRAKVFLAGPPLLRAATGEIATDEELGGAAMHAAVSGLAEYVVDNDEQAIRIAREVVSHLGWGSIPWINSEKKYAEPRYPTDELLGVVPIDYRHPYDIREVLARIVDGSEFLEFKRDYGSTTVCGEAAILGLPCALIGNNGPIDVEGSAKVTQFIQLMCQIGTPLIYLQNTTGYLVGTQSERGGIVKHGSKMIQAVANAGVPQITLYIGASFGAGNYGMCGRAFAPRFCFAWPNNRIAVMGGDQAARVLSIIAAAKGEPEAKTQAIEKQIREQFDRESSALFATARLWDDGIIDPRDTRKVLGFCLDICREAEVRMLHTSSYGVARM